MSALDLDAIEAQAAAATPGPWTREMAQDGELLPDGTGYAGDWYETKDVVREPQADGEATDHIAYCESGADATFIAAARTDVPALVRRVRELEALLAPVQEAARAMKPRREAFLADIHDNELFLAYEAEALKVEAAALATIADDASARTD